MSFFGISQKKKGTRYTSEVIDTEAIYHLKEIIKRLDIMLIMLSKATDEKIGKKELDILEEK